MAVSRMIQALVPANLDEMLPLPNCGIFGDP